MIAMPSAVLSTSGTCGKNARAAAQHVERDLRARARWSTVRLKKRWRDCSRAAWRAPSARRRRQPRDRLRADGLTGLLEPLHRAVHEAEALDRVLEPYRQRGVHRRDLIAQRAAIGVGPHRDRHHRLQLHPFGIAPVRKRCARSAPGDDGQDDVVDRPAERVLDRLERRQVGRAQAKRRCGPMRTFSGEGGAPAIPAEAIAASPGDTPPGRHTRAIRRRRVPRARTRTAPPPAHPPPRRAAPHAPGTAVRPHAGAGSPSGGSGSRSKSTVMMSTPEIPSTSA